MTDLAFSPDGKTIAAGYSGGGTEGIVLFDAATRRRQPGNPLSVKEGGVRGLAFSPGSRPLPPHTEPQSWRKQRRRGAV